MTTETGVVDGLEIFLQALRTRFARYLADRPKNGGMYLR